MMVSGFAILAEECMLLRVLDLWSFSLDFRREREALIARTIGFDATIFCSLMELNISSSKCIELLDTDYFSSCIMRNLILCSDFINPLYFFCKQY